MNSEHLERYFRDQSGCVIVRQDPRKLILRCGDPRGTAEPLFVKIYRYQGRWHSLRETLSGPSAERSLRICQRLASAGVPVPEPVGAAVDRTAMGIVRSSLFAARWMQDMTSLRDFAVPLFNRVSDGDRRIETLNRSLGIFIARLHEQGIRPRDLNAGNFLVRFREDGSFRIMLTDHEDISFSNALTGKQCVTNLAQVAAFMLPLAKNAPQQICEGYASTRTVADADRLVRAVGSRAAALLAGWQQAINARFDRVAQARKAGQ